MFCYERVEQLLNENEKELHKLSALLYKEKMLDKSYFKMKKI
jgi:ATP-dependent Zn protease